MPAIMLVLLAGTAWANVALPHIFSDHMVLQQHQPIPVWGTADPGEQVSVILGKTTKTTITDAAGRWMVHFRALNAKPASEQTGLTLTVAGKNTITFRDVLIGEVWVCSGQSNMQWAVVQAANGPHEVDAAKYPSLRLFTVSMRTAATPQSDCDGTWVACTPDTVANFSAVGYFFGRALLQTRNVPIGLINTSWGGTVCEAWTSASALHAKLPEFDTTIDALPASFLAYQKMDEQHQQALTKLYDLEDDLTSAEKIAAPAHEDSTWKTIEIPATWESQGLSDLGIVWFRKTIAVPPAWAGKDLVLNLGPIDEVDHTWFNGTLVGGKGNSRRGETSFWNVPREYTVPGKLVKAGDNLIAIRVQNGFGAGGIEGASPETMYASLADGSDVTRIALAGTWRYWPEFLSPNLPPNPNGPNNPSVLFNAMISPLIPYGIQGAIWYQGESNADRAKQYRTLLPTMISDWRTHWQEGAFPFLIVQLANLTAATTEPVQSGWAELREAQFLTTRALPKVGLALTIDIGDANDIHPRNKQEVGRRLSLAARAIAYRERLVASGPIFTGMTVAEGKATLRFANIGKELVSRGETLKGFAVCGADRKFVHAQAKIVRNTVLVWADGVATPTAVRYDWANNPDGNLYNHDGLPAVPFRTDID